MLRIFLAYALLTLDFALSIWYTVDIKGDKMLNTIILQAATMGFLLHWLISDAIYLKENPTIQAVLYVLFVVSLFSTAYSHITIMRNNQIKQAIIDIEKNKPS